VSWVPPRRLRGAPAPDHTREGPGDSRLRGEPSPEPDPGAAGHRVRGTVGYQVTASVHLYDINWPLICYFRIQFLFTWRA